VHDVEDRDPRAASAIQQHCCLLQGGLHTIELQHTVGIGVLAVDHDQRADSAMAAG
jgi:hypothetical protein